jgi:hypothetical protein
MVAPSAQKYWDLHSVMSALLYAKAIQAHQMDHSCPIICKSSRRGEKWRCRIRLERRFDENEQLLPYSEVLPFGPDIHDPAEVCDRISRAQAANLEPDRDLDYFLNVPKCKSKESFSANSVIVDIEGPDVLDLSFVDLPGNVYIQRPEIPRCLYPYALRYHCQRSRRAKGAERAGTQPGSDICGEYIKFDSGRIQVRWYVPPGPPVMKYPSL